jgi:hypothetical protein
MKKASLLTLGIAVALQLLVPTSMILKHERILRTGEIYRFKTRPIDPADPFQGRYVRLGFENNFISNTNKNETKPEYKERVFVTLSTDADGFCQMESWSRIKPTTGSFLKLTYLGRGFALPFNRFYMEESKAPHAETLVREGTRNTNCWATVRILNGAALIENVYVAGTPIRELAVQPSKRF